MEVAIQVFRSPRPELCLGRIKTQRFQIHQILINTANISEYPMAWHGMTLDLPLTTALLPEVQCSRLRNSDDYSHSDRAGKLMNFAL